MKKLTGLLLLLILVFVGCKKNSTPAAAVPEQNPSDTATHTYTYTFTIVPSATNTNTAVSSSTYTNTITRTNTPAATITNTNTRTFTMTYTRTYTQTYTNTHTRTHTNTNTATRTHTATYTSTINATQTYVAAIATQTAVAVPAYAGKWGSAGSGNGQFSGPWGIAVIGDSVYVADYGNQRVQKFTLGGTYSHSWGGFTAPTGVDGYDTYISGHIVFVTDRTTAKRYTVNGTTVYYDGAGAAAMNTMGGGSMAAINGASVYCTADDGSEKINIFKLDMTSTSFGGDGTSDGLMKNPADVCPDKVHNTECSYLYAVDTGNRRIQKFTKDGVYVSKWGSFGAGDGKFSTPQGIAVDSRGFVYVADTGNNRIQKFDANGNFLAKWGSAGTGNGQFNNPWQIAINGDRIYVTDLDNSRVQYFEY